LLSITLDNASNNDTFITELADRIETFDGNSSCTRCFLHILNLVAKTILAQFDIKTKKGADTHKGVQDGDYELRRLVSELEEAESQAVETEEAVAKESAEEDDWVDEQDDMLDDE
jgi:hypothetical protein